MRDVLKCDDVLLDCNRKLDAVLELSESIMEVADPNEVLNSVIYKLGQELGYTFPAIFLFDERRKNLKITKIGVKKAPLKSLKKHLGKNIESISFSTGSKANIVVRAALDNEMLQTKNLADFMYPVLPAKQASLLAEHLDVKLIVAIPLALRGRAIGVLAAFLDRDELTVSERILLQTMANQISIAIHTSELFTHIHHQLEAIEQRKKDLEALLDLSAIASSSLQKATILQALLDHIPAKFGHIGVLGASILLEDQKQATLKLHALTGHNNTDRIQNLLKFDLDKAIQKIEGSTLLRTVIFEKKITVFDDLREAFPDVINKALNRRIKKVSSIESYAAVPIIQGREAVGAVVLALSYEPENLDERHKEIFQLFANHVAVALENVELFEKLQSQFLQVEKQKQSLAEANERLQALDEAKSEFISIASHQLRTPLTSIRGFLSMMIEGSLGKCDGVAIDTIKKVASSTDRLVDLVNDLLDISKIERGIINLDKQPARLELIAESVVDELLPDAESKKLTLNFHRPRRSTPRVMVDSEKIKGVMLNLLDNAIKYTPKGKIDVQVKKVQQGVEFSVRDTGLGLSPQTVPRLFEKFTRGEGVSVVDTEGVGLGLFVARRIIDAHEGKIWANSEGKGKGSEFAFLIPLSKSS